MYKVLKSFCCLLLFSILNLCGVSAVDYISFDNHKPFKCSRCGKQDSLLKNFEYIREKNKDFSDEFSECDVFQNCFRAFVRSDDRKALMCIECGVKDMNEQIKSLVKEFCPKFDFQIPRREDVGNLFRNCKFMQAIPMEYKCNLEVFQDEKYVCKICNKGLGGNEPEMFEKGSYYSCFDCENVFHGTCTAHWIRSGNSICPVCGSTSGIVNYNVRIVAQTRRENFGIWVHDGCPSSYQSRLEFLCNINRADGDERVKLRKKLRNCEMSDELLDLFLPKRVAPVRVAPQSKCARFCDCLRSLFGC